MRLLQEAVHPQRGWKESGKGQTGQSIADYSQSPSCCDNIYTLVWMSKNSVPKRMSIRFKSLVVSLTSTSLHVQYRLEKVLRHELRGASRSLWAVVAHVSQWAVLSTGDDKSSPTHYIVHWQLFEANQLNRQFYCVAMRDSLNIHSLGLSYFNSKSAYFVMRSQIWFQERFF